MIEVLFRESEAGSMKAAKNKRIMLAANGPTAFFMAGKKKPPERERGGFIEGTPEEVICLALMLDIGEINRDVSDEYRKELIFSLFDQGQWGNDSKATQKLKEDISVYGKELERLKKFLDDGEEIRIWYSRSAYSLCGLYFVCNLLNRCTNRIFAVELPEYRTYNNIIATYQNWGEISAEEFALFLGGQRELTTMEIRRYAQFWTELVEDNSPLRALINNHVMGVNEDFYDFLILKNITEEPVMQGRLIGSILGHYPISVGDWWYAKRIQYYIDRGVIEVVQDSEKKYARQIRRK